MKFVCLECSDVMAFEEYRDNEEGHPLRASFRCPSCDWGFEMNLNSQEARMVRTLGIPLGEPEQPPPAMAMMRRFVAQEEVPNKASGLSEYPFGQLVSPHSNSGH